MGWRRGEAAARGCCAAARRRAGSPGSPSHAHLEERGADAGVVVGVHVRRAARRRLAVCLTLTLALVIAGVGRRRGARSQLGVGRVARALAAAAAALLLIIINIVAAGRRRLLLITRVDLKVLPLLLLLLALAAAGALAARRLGCVCRARPLAPDLRLQLAHLTRGGWVGGGRRGRLRV